MRFLKEVYEKQGSISLYDKSRRALHNPNKNLLKLDTITSRFFGGDAAKLLDAVKGFNHKVKTIKVLKNKIDVYDLEVPGTHNFALSSGVFVHNSARQGRDRRFQAILPLKGKILNVEKARLDKVLSNEEIKTIITALGCGIGEEFNTERLRYHKVILMADADVDGSHIRTLLLTFFYRQMPKLLEEGRIYIAQPPLYKVKRGKREEYIQTEPEMDALLLDMGTDDLVLSKVKPAGELSNKQTRDLCAILIQIAQISKTIERRGVRFSKYLSLAQAKTKKLPLFMIKVEGMPYFAYSDAELAKLIKQHEKTSGKKLELHGETDKDAPTPKDVDVVEFFEAETLTQAANSLGKLGVSLIDAYAPQAAAENNTSARKKSSTQSLQPILKLKTGGETIPLYSLKELLDAIKERAKQGMVIQRYKGLGEMNPEQLWETTMDPARRTLLSITIEDAVKANEMFTVLMGDAVEPRREFIEQHAREVTNLDI
jgi:DNA gyrase subunit B